MVWLHTVVYCTSVTSHAGFLSFNRSISMTWWTPLLSFCSVGGSRERVVHSHHLHCAFQRQRQAWHWQAKRGVPLNNIRRPRTSGGQRTLQTVQQRRPDTSGGDRTRQQPRNEYHARRSGPQATAFCARGGAVRGWTVSTGAQWARCQRGCGNGGGSPRGTASHHPRGCSVGTDGSLKADTCKKGP